MRAPQRKWGAVTRNTANACGGESNTHEATAALGQNDGRESSSSWTTEMPPLTQQFAEKINVLISASDLQFGGLGTCLCKECFSSYFLAETKSKTCQRWVANKRSLCLVFLFSHEYHHFIPGRANTSVLDNCLVTSGFLQSLTCWQNYNWVWPTERRLKKQHLNACPRVFTCSENPKTKALDCLCFPKRQTSLSTSPSEFFRKV